jgi:hypothetical protein
MPQTAIFPPWMEREKGNKMPKNVKPVIGALNNFSV